MVSGVGFQVSVKENNGQFNRERNFEKANNEYPPAMHSALSLCNH
jgi:hypothetical protein